MPFIVFDSFSVTSDLELVLERDIECNDIVDVSRSLTMRIIYRVALMIDRVMVIRQVAFSVDRRFSVVSADVVKSCL